MKLRKNRNLLIALFGAVVLIATFDQSTNTAPEPLSIDSPRDDGTKGVVELLERFGTKATEGQVGPGVQKAVLFEDALSVRQSEETEAWIKAGGTLILADPYSSFAGELTLFRGNPTEPLENLRPECSSPFAAGAELIQPRRQSNLGRPLASLSSAFATEACYSIDGGYYMLVAPSGRGQVVLLASPDIFINERLDVADNSVLATNLLASDNGRITVVTPRTFVPGEETEGDATDPFQLLPERFNSGIYQLLIAGLLLMLWRGRRLGRPLEETLPVELPASALTVALGNMLQTAGRSGAAAQVLRRQMRRELAHMLGLRADTDPAVLAEVASERTRIDKHRLSYLLTDGPPLDNEQLIQLAQQLERLHEEVSNVR